MDLLRNFLINKYKNINKYFYTKNILKDIIFNICDIKLNDDQININNSLIKLNIHPLKKNEILLNKNKILLEFKNQTNLDIDII